MRIGFNPQKDKELSPNDFFHQVVIPVHIPNFEGYFKDSFQIFKYSLESLFKTSHSKTYFTVINNGSCNEVVKYLDKLYKEGNIHELLHTTAIGKLNSILKGLSGQNFPLITITDADVLFLSGWQVATYEVFTAFSKTGAVCPTPSSKTLKQNTSNVVVENLFSEKLKFRATTNQEAMQAFAHSIGNPQFYNKAQLTNSLKVINEDSKAVVGAGHFVTTYRGEVFDKLTERYSKFNLGGNSEIELLDKPVAEKGFWRLSTDDNYAYHMGNIAEDWMEDCLAGLQNQVKTEIFCPQLKPVKHSKLVNSVKRILFFKILCRRPVWYWFLRYKGLNKEIAKNY